LKKKKEKITDEDEDEDEDESTTHESIIPQASISYESVTHKEEPVPNISQELQKYRINQDIIFNTILVIDETGKKLGSMNKEDALKLAKSKSLDLVQLSEDIENSQSTCKIMNFKTFSKAKVEAIKKSKDLSYLYEEEDDEREKKILIFFDKLPKVKELRFTARVENKDLEVKGKHILEFLEKGYGVKVILLLTDDDLVMSPGISGRQWPLFDKIKKFVHSMGYLVDVTTYKKRIITGYFIPNSKKQELLDLQTSSKHSPKLTNDKQSPKPINDKQFPKPTNYKQQKPTTNTQSQNNKSTTNAQSQNNKPQPNKLKKPYKSDFKRW